jgi:hypothetical protein
MVILGGLEIVIGGYFIHRHYKHKNEKKQLQEEEEKRRHNAFPGANPPNGLPQLVPVLPPQQKYASHAPPSYTLQPQPQPCVQGRPRPCTAQTFPREQPHPGPPRQMALPPHMQLIQQEIQPLQRADSFSTLSHMPVADGLHRHDSRRPPQLPARPQPSPRHTIPRRPLNANSPYNNTAFSLSTPAFGPVQHVQYTSASANVNPGASAPNSAFGRSTVDDNWETNGQQSQAPHVEVSEPTEQRDDDPPPPYMP